MNKNFFCLVSVVFTLLTACSSSPVEDLDGKDESNEPAPKETFSLFSINSEYESNMDDLVNLIGNVNSDIVAIQKANKDFSMKTAHSLVENNQRWQAHFFSESYLVPDKGTGFLTKSIINSTEKKVLDEVLTFGIVTYQFGSGEEIWVSTCDLAGNDREKQIRQAKALADFADKVERNIVIAVAVSGNEIGEVLDILDKKYHRACNPMERNISSTAKNGYNFILTPLKQNWSVSVDVIESEGTSVCECIKAEIGLK